MNDLSRHIIPTIRQTSGRVYPALEREINNLPLDTQRDLLRMLQDLQDAVNAVKRKARMGLPF